MTRDKKIDKLRKALGSLLPRETLNTLRVGVALMLKLYTISSVYITLFYRFLDENLDFFPQFEDRGVQIAMTSFTCSYHAGMFAKFLLFLYHGVGWIVLVEYAFYVCLKETIRCIMITLINLYQSVNFVMQGRGIFQPWGYELISDLYILPELICNKIALDYQGSSSRPDTFCGIHLQHSYFWRRRSSGFVKRYFMGIKPLQRFVGVYLMEIDFSNHFQIRFVDRKGRTIRKKMVRGIFRICPGYVIIAYIERFVVDDRLAYLYMSKPVVNLLPLPNFRVYQGGNESLFDLEFEEMWHNDEFPICPQKRAKFYSVVENLAAFIGSFRRFMANKRRLGRIPKHELCGVVLPFFRAIGIRSVTVTTIDLCKRYFGMNEEWEYQADNELEFLFFVLSLPFQRAGGRGKFQNALYNFKRAGGTMDQGNLLVSAGSFFFWMWNCGLAALESKSFEPFFHSGPSWFKWMRSSEKVLQDFHLFEDGTISFHDYLAQLDMAISQGEKIHLSLSRTSKTSYSFRYVDSMMSKLKEIGHKESVIRRVRRERQPPFFIAVYGNPGSGKTCSIKLLIKTALDAAGEKYDVQRIHSHNCADKYASGLRTFHNAILIDDISAINPETHPEIAISGHRLVMEVANTIPVATAQAAIEDKGVVFAQPKIVAVTSNDADLGAKRLQHPSAFLRRIGYRIQLHVKEEYAKEGTNALDISKLPKDTSLVIPHYYTVVEYKFHALGKGEPFMHQERVVDPANEEGVYTEKIIHNRVEPHVFFVWLHEAVAKHFSVGRSFLRTMNEALDTELCEICRMVPAVCDCKERLGFDLQQQGCISDIFMRKVKSDIMKKAERSRRFFKEFWKEAVSRVRLPSIVQKFADEVLFKHYNILQAWPEALVSIGVVYMLAGVDKERPKVEDEFEQQSKKVQESEQYLRKLDEGTSPNVWLPGEREEFLISESARSLTVHDFVMLIMRNLVFIKGGSWSQALFLNSHMLLIPTHVYQPAEYFEIEDSNGHSKRHELDEVTPIAYDKTREMVLCSVNGYQKRDISYLLPQSIPMSQPIGPTCVISLTQYSGARCKTTQVSMIKMSSNPKPFLAREGITDKASYFGDCGSIYYTIIGKVTPVMCGFHVGGKHDTITYLPLSWQQLDFDAPAVLELPIKVDLSHNGLCQIANYPIKQYQKEGNEAYSPNSYLGWALRNKPDDIPEHVTLLGSVGYPLGGSWRSKIRDSKLQGHIPMSVRQPPKWETILIDGEKYTPVRRAHKDLWDHIAKPKTNVPWDLALEVIKRRYTKVLGKYEKMYPLTEHSSLNGLEGVRYVDKVKHNKGAGLPCRGPKMDRLLIGTPENLMYTAVGRKSVDFVCKCMVAGINPGIVCDVNFKDEVKKPEKAIRTFAAFPAIYNEIMRRMTLIMFKFVQENYILTGMTIGVDCCSKQWENIYLKHMNFPYHVFWDFFKYDKTHPRIVLKYVSLLMLHIASIVFHADATVCGYPVLFLLARGLALGLDPIYVWRDALFQLAGTLASGKFDTAQCNTLIQEFILELCWIHFKGESVIRQELQRGEDSFMSECARDGLGDDGGLSTIHKDFNLKFISSYCKDYLGYIMTSPDKSDVMPDNFPPGSWNYLKRGFFHHRGRVWAPLERESILKNVNWHTPTRSLTEEQSHFEFVQSALMECAAAGDDRYRELYNQIVKAFYTAFPGSRGVRKFLTFDQEQEIQLDKLAVDKDGTSTLWKRSGMDVINYYRAFWKVKPLAQQQD